MCLLLIAKLDNRTFEFSDSASAAIRRESEEDEGIRVDDFRPSTKFVGGRSVSRNYETDKTPLKTPNTTRMPMPTSTPPDRSMIQQDVRAANRLPGILRL